MVSYRSEIRLVRCARPSRRDGGTHVVERRQDLGQSKSRARPRRVRSLRRGASSIPQRWSGRATLSSYAGCLRSSVLTQGTARIGASVAPACHLLMLGDQVPRHVGAISLLLLRQPPKTSQPPKLITNPLADLSPTSRASSTVHRGYSRDSPNDRCHATGALGPTPTPATLGHAGAP